MLKRTQKYIGMQKHSKWLSYFILFISFFINLIDY